jgi:hypothetical protein
MMNNVTNITKFWISGFTQADGSFVVGFEKRNQGEADQPTSCT